MDREGDSELCLSEIATSGTARTISTLRRAMDFLERSAAFDRDEGLTNVHLLLDDAVRELTSVLSSAEQTRALYEADGWPTDRGPLLKQ